MERKSDAKRKTTTRAHQHPNQHGWWSEALEMMDGRETSKIKKNRKKENARQRCEAEARAKAEGKESKDRSKRTKTITYQKRL